VLMTASVPKANAIVRFAKVFRRIEVVAVVMAWSPVG
jgi:hypothetical protein